ncbi:FecCD transport family protein [Geosporobacter subterraneus DSM 17957]|uniref:FecCD transport family protein n=1 Tax=Geosporobacter subterraneus DSM 17957 TaxID=1121919 RepID=A0A1M6Q5W4_9FIRM|nr:iron chelate uptake ABC transporter family permease subunit [Geosporobacter subterraneus]SHK15591.1 FecCD transport family protein [Geosporobacter subterraneus DSM 17957]
MISSVKDRRAFRMMILCLYAGAVVLGFFVCNMIGSMKISVSDILRAIMSDEQTAQRLVIWSVRIPRTILASLVGVNLALSGAILQGVMKNPLADPGIIGISSGAGLVGIIILILFPQYQMLVPLGAFIGAMGAPL